MNNVVSLKVIKGGKRLWDPVTESVGYAVFTACDKVCFWAAGNSAEAAVKAFEATGKSWEYWGPDGKGYYVGRIVARKIPMPKRK